MRILVLALTLLTGTVPAFSGAWQLPPPDATGLLLVTGSDLGYVEPKHCWKGSGGGHYRVGLQQYLAEARSGLPLVWLSTGNVLSTFVEDPMVRPPKEVFAALARLPYTAVGVGQTELEVLEPAPLLRIATAAGVPLVATNVVEWETGRSFARASVLVTVGGARIGILAVRPHDPQLIWESESGTSIVTIEPRAAIESEVARIDGAVDHVIVLSTLLQTEVRELADVVRGVDVIIAASGGLILEEEEQRKAARIFWIGAFGEVLGQSVLAAGSEPRPFQSIRVDDSFPIDPITGERRAVPMESEP